MNSTKSDWLVPAALVALSLVPAIAGAVRLAELAAAAPEDVELEDPGLTTGGCIPIAFVDRPH